MCTEVSREQVELLEMHNDSVVVAEYWANLPPRAELEAKRAEIVRDARSASLAAACPLPRATTTPRNS